MKCPERLACSLKSLTIVRWILVVGIVFFVPTSLLARARINAERPNVVLILADDLGWSDLRCYGSDFHQTPHLDNFCSTATRFTHAYAPAPVCTPTRAALMTGKAPARLGITIWSEGSLSGPNHRKLQQADSRHDLPLSEKTMAEYFDERGYLTASIGKWHLGDAAHSPETQGFDINIGGTHWGAPTTFFWPYKGLRTSGNEYRYVPGLPYGDDGEYLTNRLTDEAIQFIDKAHQTSQPFFLYLAHHAPHTPIEALPSDVNNFRNRKYGTIHKNPVYAAMIKSLDDSVGRVLERLEELQLSQNTIVIFTSDNGGYLGSMKFEGQDIAITSNAPLRSGKGTCYEGGLRVPLLIRWPRCEQPKVCDALVTLTDLFPTIVHEIAPDELLVTDGVDLKPLLKSSLSSIPSRSFYFHYPHYYHAPSSTPVSAIRKGDWKLLQYYEDGHTELYNLRSDPSESTDLAAIDRATAAELKNELNGWLLEVGAKLPTARSKSP
jgi:arylsulfatase A